MIVTGYDSSEDEEIILPSPVVLNPEVVSEFSVEAVPEKLLNVGGVVEKAEEATIRMKRSKQNKPKKPKRKRWEKQDAAEMDYEGPWAKSSDSSEQEVEDNQSEQEEAEVFTVTESAPTTELYGLNSYMEVPTDVKIDLEKKAGSWECFAPKRVQHVFKGHSKGVTKVEFFPGSGHLLLSSGNDGNIYLWDVYHKHEMLRGYFGHRQAVKDVRFNSTGTRFLSCSYDKKVLLWDTETGEILRTISVEGTPNVVQFNPNNENEFLVGLANKRIEHYDLESPESLPIQVYDHHLGAINSLTVVDSNKRFMSTSDDRTVRFWDWQINIPVKIIADPAQHSMPCAAVNPADNFIAFQTMDNTVQCVQGSGKFRFNRKKTFEGHRVAGYGIQVDFSPDGKLLMSGDASGYAYFWFWKSGKVLTKIKVSDSYVSCIRAHPQEASAVAVAGNSGDIYYCE